MSHEIVRKYSKVCKFDNAFTPFSPIFEYSHIKFPNVAWLHFKKIKQTLNFSICFRSWKSATLGTSLLSHRTCAHKQRHVNKLMPSTPDTPEWRQIPLIPNMVNQPSRAKSNPTWPGALPLSQCLFTNSGKVNYIATLVHVPDDNYVVVVHGIHVVIIDAVW